MFLSFRERSTKLRYVSTALGYDHSFNLLYNYLNDQVVPCICMNEQCSYVIGAARDTENGHCPNCNTDTVASIFILAGVE